MIKERIRNLYRHEIEAQLTNHKEASAKDLLDLLFGTYNNDYNTDLVIKRKYGPTPVTTILHRLNALWVYPLFILIIAPFRYIAFGQAQLSEDSKIGSIFISLLGEMK